MSDESVLNYVAIGISILALLGSLLSVISTIKYSRINVIHTLQQLMLQKANDCNLLWGAAAVNKSDLLFEHKGYVYTDTISEVIISIQLLDNSLESYSQMDRRYFFLKQFWIQLNTSLREYFKNVDYGYYHETTAEQIINIRYTFGQFFEKY